MALIKLEDFDPSQTPSAGDIRGFTVYTEETDEKIGSVSDVLVDESGYFQYLVVDFGLWLFNKKVMLPEDHSRIDNNAQRVYVLGLNRKQAENLPEYNDRVLVDNDDAEQSKRRHYNLEGASSQEIEAKVNPVEAIDNQEQVVIQQPSPVDLTTTVSAGEKVTRSACLVFNPVAGQSDPEQDLATIRRILETEFSLDIRTTTPDVDADQLAQEAVDRGAEIIIASGGDGTLSAAAEVVIGTGVPLGVISRGTANAFATALGIPLAIEAACETILAGKTRVIDAAHCNGKPMALLAGIGFEAEAVERADREAKNRFGMLAYVLAGFEGLRNLKPFEARIETEDKIITLNAAAITIANAAPPTSVLAQGPAELVADDGLLDVTLVAPANSISAIAAAYNLLQSARSAATTDRPDVGFFRARSIKVTTNPPQKVVLDGELTGYTPVDIECIPGGLTIFVPTTQEAGPLEKLEGLPNIHVELKEPNVED